MALLAVAAPTSRVSARSGLRSSASRLLFGAIGVVAAAHLTVPGRPATVCPLRALTGIPCPFCGGTTAAVHLGRLDALGALRANPFVVVGALALVLRPGLTALRRTLFRGAPWQLSPRAFVTVAAIALCGSEIWQLVRFGVV